MIPEFHILHGCCKDMETMSQYKVSSVKQFLQTGTKANQITIR